ncbi:hypothetical protein [Salininema proteolyticum]|uniref:Formate dehydrogenase accessory protein FdhE n=1 Tax=Salininema proteolyticum TaxID=1607685 RepID=A0ABV8TWD0_9ACTN
MDDCAPSGDRHMAEKPASPLDELTRPRSVAPRDGIGRRAPSLLSLLHSNVAEAARASAGERSADLSPALFHALHTQSAEWAERVGLPLDTTQGAPVTALSMLLRDIAAKVDPEPVLGVEFERFLTLWCDRILAALFPHEFSLTRRSSPMCPSCHSLRSRCDRDGEQIRVHAGSEWSVQNGRRSGPRCVSCEDAWTLPQEGAGLHWRARST